MTYKRWPSSQATLVRRSAAFVARRRQLFPLKQAIIARLARLEPTSREAHLSPRAISALTDEVKSSSITAGRFERRPRARRCLAELRDKSAGLLTSAKNRRSSNLAACRTSTTYRRLCHPRSRFRCGAVIDEPDPVDSLPRDLEPASQLLPSDEHLVAM